MLQLECYRIRVEGHVIGKQRPRVVSHNGRVHAFTPRPTEHAEYLIARAWQQASETPETAILGPLSVRVHIWTPRPKGHYRTARGHESEVRPGAPYSPTSRPDLDNCIKTALDALTGVAWRDDDQVVHLMAEKSYGPERWEVEVMPLPEPC